MTVVTSWRRAEITPGFYKVMLPSGQYQRKEAGELREGDVVANLGKILAVIREDGDGR